MKLLICTQTIDKNDPILGFFHRWVEEFAKHFDAIQVICLKEGDHSLPKNVTVHSLGKESGESFFKYVTRFYRYLFTLQGSYDRVFVHMNPHYIMLGGIWWMLARTPIYFWRNHARMNIMTRIAARFASLVFYTSPFACTSRYAHARQMPVGIDTNLFVVHEETEDKNTRPKKILFLGRVSPVKRVEVFIETAKYLSPAYEFHIYGDAPKKDLTYYETQRAQAGTNVFFHTGVTNTETPEVYRMHDLYVNLTPEGSMDKTVFEAAACGVPVLVSNTSFRGTVPEISITSDVSPKYLAERIVSILEQGTEKRQNTNTETRKLIVTNHSLAKLATMLYNYMQ